MPPNFGLSGVTAFRRLTEPSQACIWDGHFAKWRTDGVLDQLNGLLRELVRHLEGGRRHLSACVTDAQSIKTSTDVPVRGQGIDAGKKTVGRKRSIITDTLGLLPPLLVTAAEVQDSTAGRNLLEQPAATYPNLRKVPADGGYRKHRVERTATRHQT